MNRQEKTIDNLKQELSKVILKTILEYAEISPEVMIQINYQAGISGTFTYDENASICAVTIENEFDMSTEF